MIEGFFTSLKSYSSSYLVFDVSNPMLGYVFLIDSKGRIRWSAKGPPGEGELDALACVFERLT